MCIRFFNDDIQFILKNKRKISDWLRNIAKEESKTIGNLNFVFVSNEKILELNKKFLKHNDFTDIITFNNSSENDIAGEMYISIETVKENAKYYKVDFKEELYRVMVHGLLHLCGYKDDTENEQKEMRDLENKYLKEL